ncbi:hypothetical protein GGH99_008775, partial [Coemansia sp. RSA 1285]
LRPPAAARAQRHAPGCAGTAANARATTAPAQSVAGAERAPRAEAAQARCPGPRRRRRRQPAGDGVRRVRIHQARAGEPALLRLQRGGHEHDVRRPSALLRPRVDRRLQRLRRRALLDGPRHQHAAAPVAHARRRHRCRKGLQERDQGQGARAGDAGLLVPHARRPGRLL